MKDIVIRHARIGDCPALARVLIDATRDAFQGSVPDRCLNWITPKESAENWAKNFKTEQSLGSGDFLFVAEVKKVEVIGLAMLSKISPHGILDLMNPDQYLFELRTLQVDPEWQHRGVGRALVSRVADQLLGEGSTSLMVGILSENPNRGFYEHLGAVYLGSRPYDWEGYQTEEILYGWSDVNKLVNKNPTN